MPEVQEVFRMATQKVRPDPGALERQQRQQRRSTIRRKVGAYGLVAAVVGAIAVVAVRAGVDSGEQVPGDQPSSPTTAPGAQPVAIVTFDGSTCSMEITADRIEPGPLGFVPFRVVNATEKRVMFDSWRLLEGYTFRAFEATIELDRRLAEKPGNQGAFPSRSEVSYLGSEIIPANSSDIIVPQMFTPGRHAIVCLRPFEGDFRPFGIAGPIVVR
ncbi:MAG TPA: hypothetical protein VFZ75_05580 [Actinomycetota bacterium]|nr:hypothetical protein [Actinomycetota bacterium]